MNPVIISRTVTGPGLKSRPMATYCEPSQRAIIRARRAQHEQREARERAELAALLLAVGWEPEPRPQRPPPEPEYNDPVLTAEFIAGLLAQIKQEAA